MNNKYYRSDSGLKSNITPNSKKEKDPLESLDLYQKPSNNSSSLSARNPRSTSLDRLNALTSAYNQVMNNNLGSTLGSTGRLSK